ncbi:hypothetical protein KSS87_007272 [Heliosperma pusillum]|nr:hypothetical protein KSS87_007272 [Heliosperma pusillum]
MAEMGEDLPVFESPRPRSGLLRDQVRLTKRKDCDRYEIVPIDGRLSYEKGFFVVIRACQLLAQKNDGIIFVGIAGPSGAGKTVFTEKMLNFMPSIAVISMDNYNDASRIIDGNFDDPRLTDYDTLLDNICGLKEGKAVQVPIYDFKSSSRAGYRTIEAPSSRIVIIEGIYALSEKLRPFLDLRVSVTGGVHFDLVKRVLRDIQRAGQEPEEIIHQISETVYPMYKAFIEPDLETAHVKIINKFNPFTGFQNPTYILKSRRTVTEDQIKEVIPELNKETKEETYDIYLLPPGEDPEACQSYLRMRNRDGKYNLMFEEWVTDSPFIISPRITFEVSVRLLGGLMALGYTIATILKRRSHIFADDKVIVKIDWLEQLNRQYVQSAVWRIELGGLLECGWVGLGDGERGCWIKVQGKDRSYVMFVAEQLGLDGSYVPRTYIEQIQLEKLVNDVMALPEDLKTKLSIDDEVASSPKEALSRASADRRVKYLNRNMSRSFSTNREKHLSKLTKLAVNVNERNFNGISPLSPAGVANQGAVNQLSDQISTLNERMDEFTSRIEELNSKFSIPRLSASLQNLAVPSEACNGSATPLLMAGLSNGPMTGTLLPHSSSSSQLMDSQVMEEIMLIARGQRQIMHQMDILSSLLHEYFGEKSRQDRIERTVSILDSASVIIPLALTVAIGGVLFFRKS